MIRVMVVEDEPFWQQAVAFELTSYDDIELISLCDSISTASNEYEKMAPDVIVLDVSLGNQARAGIAFAHHVDSNRQFSDKQPHVVMLTSHDESELIADCFAAGVSNYLCKKDIGRLPMVIQGVVQQRDVLTSYAGNALRQGFMKLREQADKDLLTEKEKEVLHYIHMGHALSKIANLMFVTSQTIKNHVNKILKKLDVTSSKEAAKLAARKGWLEY